MLFIEKTRNVVSAKEVELLKTGRNILAINKISDKDSTIGLVGPIEVKREVEIQEDLSDLMQKAIDKKRRVLEQIKEKGYQMLLLFYDAYAFGYIEDAHAALLKVKGYDWFHSIFWAASFAEKTNELFPQEPGRKGGFLFTKFTTLI